MEKKIMQKRTITAVILFIVVFGSLLALASVYDLQVSQKLTDGNLTRGNYYADTFFGVSLEVMGSFPIWLAIASAGAILFWNTKRKTLFTLKEGANDKILNAINVILGFCGIVVAVASMYLLFADSFKYILKYLGYYSFKKDPKYIASMLIFTAIFTPLLISWFGKKSDEQIKDLKTILWVILVALATRIFIEGIKAPVGRIRFRAMNTILAETEYLYGVNRFDYFTPWYVINGAREMTDKGLEVFLVSNNIPTWELEDACRSFPSGHTFAAGMSYVLMLIPDINKKYNNVLGRAVWFLIPFAYTTAVAISRIMVGAHYFSDVLFGGTIVFLGVIIGREIFVCHGSHIKCFMKDKK